MLMAVGSDGGTLCHLSGHVHAWFAQERREPSQGGADTVLDSTSSVHNHACEAWASFVPGFVLVHHGVPTISTGFVL